MKKVFRNAAVFIVIFSLLFFVTSNSVYANSTNTIDMDIYIDAGGNAHITEIWSAYLDKGTEGYRAFNNLGNASISDFSVSDDTGANYTYLSQWNTGADFSSKAYKNGINYISGGLELCWGISNYGSRTYTLSYTISNFVTQYTDTQGIYFNLVNLDQSIGNVIIKIHSDTDFSLDNARIWAFGYDGTIVFEDGNIVLNSNGMLSASRYMVALVRFENNIFDASNNSGRSFDDIYDEAMVGANENDNNPDLTENEYNYNTDYNRSSFFGILTAIVSVLFNPIFLVIVIMIVYSIITKVKGKDWLFGSSKKSGLDFGAEGRTLPANSEINYWREIPCNKDLRRAYWIAFQYYVVSESTLKKGIIGAILLKWIKQGLITVSKTKKGLFSLKDNNYAISFNNIAVSKTINENELLEILQRAAGSNGILEAKEFERWCKNNYIKMESWFSKLIGDETSKLEKDGFITNVDEEVPAMFGRTKTITMKKVNSVLKDDAVQLKGLKKFLLDFSLIYEREHFEVHIWEEYLIFAELLGIADKVAEQFSKLYPDFKQVSDMDIDFTTVVASHMASIGYKGMVAGRERAERYSGSDSSSGGGGSSFSGGGGSSGGSSGGGFR